jgi:hypothetical protein
MIMAIDKAIRKLAEPASEAQPDVEERPGEPLTCDIAEAPPAPQRLSLAGLKAAARARREALFPDPIDNECPF